MQMEYKKRISASLALLGVAPSTKQGWTLDRSIRARASPALVVLTALLAFVWRLRDRLRKTPRGCPWFLPNLFLGIIPAFAKAVVRREHNEFLYQVHQRLGRTFATRPGLLGFFFYYLGINLECVITMDPRNIQHILKDNFDNYPKGKVLAIIFRDLLGNGIFNADGQDWYHQRKTTSKMFTANLFKEHIWQVVRQNARKVRSMLQAADPTRPVDIFNVMNRFTLDTIGEIGFGKSIGSLEDPSSPFLKSFDMAQQITFTRVFSPLWIPNRFLGIGTERGTREHFGRLDEYSRAVVRELQAALAANGTKGVAWADIEARKSFLGLFMEDARKRGEELDEDYLRDLVLNFLIAGRDTTAQALSWTFYCLATHPEVEAKARQEVLDVCEDGPPCYEDMARLPYLQAVLSEALRLYPSVPNDIKRAIEDDTWPDGTFIPAGTNIVYNIFSMGRDRATWGDDAEMFRPERWTEMQNPPSMYEYPVFNAGPRECLGKRLAQVEMKACLAMLLPCLSLKLAVPPSMVKADAQLTIGMSSGLPMYVVSMLKQDDQLSNASTEVQSVVTSCPSEDE